jgi:hypothetical protein
MVLSLISLLRIFGTGLIANYDGLVIPVPYFKPGRENFSTILRSGFLEFLAADF